jgi:hypothetical protein
MRSSTTTPTPSLQPTPSAESAKDLHRPSTDEPLVCANGSGEKSSVTPPAMASEQSPLRSAWVAMCSATNDDEHAVSTEIAGPSRPSVYATRPVTMLPSAPVPRKKMFSGASALGPGS